MSLEELLKAGEVDSPSKVKYPAKSGGGFMVSMEAPHQLHCLVSYNTPKVLSILPHVL
jgi:hypothetical protein